MKFYKHLYIGKSIKNPGMVKLKLRTNAGLFGIYVITLAEGENQLEIYSAALLKQKLHRKLWPPYIIGIANGQEEAVGIVGQIAEECIKATGNAMLKDYLLGPGKQ